MPVISFFALFFVDYVKIIFKIKCFIGPNIIEDYLYEDNLYENDFLRFHILLHFNLYVNTGLN